ncbi:MAG: hypothetical protein A2Y93_13895 [Chloroflexi bacterium RBG_13_68_17]|nr:MAG: hypothetical protein A2Y93_13895 [Chloroflexi bacterium RBG_13_68_17]
MRRRRTAPLTTRKHLARAERERVQRRWILGGTLIVLLIVASLIAYGWLQGSFFQPRQSVAIVNGEEITTAQFQSRVRLVRLGLISQAQNAENLRSLFGGDPSISSMIDQQIASIEQQLADPTALGLNTLEGMIDEVLVRQEANRRGITVRADEVTQSIEEDFGFYANGTPTPLPTSTESPSTPTAATTPTGTAPATAAPTAAPSLTPTAGPSPTVTQTPTPFPTATAYTLDAYQADYAARIAFLEQVGADEAAFRSQYEARLYRERILQALEAEVPREQEQVHARHILVADEATALELLGRLQAGDSWDELAAEFSLDESNRDAGGDLGWFPHGMGVMIPQFEDAAFATAVGEISQPVQTSSGWHLIQVLAKEVRPLSDGQYQQGVQARLDDWLAQQRDAGGVEIRSYWIDRVPSEPSVSSLQALQ